MKRFKSPWQVQRFLSIHDQVANVFSRRLNQDTAAKFRIARNQAFTTWAEVTGVAMAHAANIAIAREAPPSSGVSDMSLEERRRRVEELMDRHRIGVAIDSLAPLQTTKSRKYQSVAIFDPKRPSS
jgi:hypothetical protein